MPELLFVTSREKNSLRWFITSLTTILRFGKAKNVTRVICPIPIYYVKLMCSLGSCSACSSPQLNCLLMIEIWYAYFLCVRGTQIWLKHSMNIKSFGSCIGDVTFPSTTAELKTTLLRHLWKWHLKRTIFWSQKSLHVNQFVLLQDWSINR